MSTLNNNVTDALNNEALRKQVNSKQSESTLPQNFMAIIFAALIKDQITIANIQAVGAKTGLALSEVMNIIADALDPNNENTPLGKLFKEMREMIDPNSSNPDRLLPGDDAKTVSRKTAILSAKQQQQQGISTALSNSLTQGNVTRDQNNNRVQQDNTDLSQKMQVLTAVYSIASTNAQLIAR